MKHDNQRSAQPILHNQIPHCLNVKGTLISDTRPALAQADEGVGPPPAIQYAKHHVKLGGLSKLV